MHFAHEVAADQPGAGFGFCDEAGVVEIGASRARRSCAPRERSRRTSARVSIAFDGRRCRARCRYSLEALLGAEVARRAAMFADDEPGQVRPAAFDVLGVDAVVADLRVGHRDDLAAVDWDR